MAALEIRSDIAAAVSLVLVAPDAQVRAGDELIILESMKMEVPVTAPGPARVSELLVSVGQPVKEGQLLLRLDVG